MHEDQRKDLADAIRDEKALKKCYRHGCAVYYDEPKCPACTMLLEHIQTRPPKNKPVAD